MSTRQLFVWGSRYQIEQIKMMINQMAVPEAPQVPQQGSYVRSFPVAPEDLQRIIYLWSETTGRDVQVMPNRSTEGTNLPPSGADASPADERIEQPATIQPQSVPSNGAGSTDDRAARANSRSGSVYRLVGQVIGGQPEAVEQPAEQPQPQQSAAPPIYISSEGGRTVIMSLDTKALDSLEEFIMKLMSNSSSTSSTYTTFYLQHAEAGATADEITRIIAGRTVTQIVQGTSSTGSNSTLGTALGTDSVAAKLQDLARQGTSSSSNTVVTIVPVSRLNALFVSGGPAEIELVRGLVEELDVTEGPVKSGCSRCPAWCPCCTPMRRA